MWFVYWDKLNVPFNATAVIFYNITTTILEVLCISLYTFPQQYIFGTFWKHWDLHESSKQSCVGLNQDFVMMDPPLALRWLTRRRPLWFWLVWINLPLFPSDRSVSSWLRRAKSSRVLKSVGAQPRSCGTWWCRSAACPSNTRGTATAEWASLNIGSPPWASCTGTLQTHPLHWTKHYNAMIRCREAHTGSFWSIFIFLTHLGANSSLSSRNSEWVFNKLNLIPLWICHINNGCYWCKR